MKKTIKLLLLSLVVVMFAGLSCTPKKPLCEQNNFGHVTVYNYTSIYLWVDATNEGSYYNDETRLAPGGSKLFVVSPGEITMWVANDYNKSQDLWNVDYTYVDQCDEATFTWTGGKSAAVGDPNKIYNDQLPDRKGKHE
jgi:hypothetical protein